MGKPWTYGMQNKFLVVKLDDINKHLTRDEQDDLEVILQSVAEGREREGKSFDNRYLVINTDEPYAEEVGDILKNHGHWG